MVKICVVPIKKPSLMRCKNCIKTVMYPTTWKKFNVVPVHMKGDKQIFSNYRPFSLFFCFW